MDATTDFETLSRLLDELATLDPASAPDLAVKLADGLAAALDALEEGAEA